MSQEAFSRPRRAFLGGLALRGFAAPAFFPRAALPWVQAFTTSSSFSLISRSPRLFGTPDDINVRLEELAKQGMNNWMFYITPNDPKKYELVETLSKGVIANFA